MEMRRVLGNDQGRHESRLAIVLIAERTSELKAQHVAGDIVGETQGARAQVRLGQGAARICGIGPQHLRPADAD